MCLFPGGVLRISSDRVLRDDRMGAKLKTPKKSHAEFQSHQVSERVMISQYDISGRNHICSVKTQSSRA